ncbi:hypothetical protein L0156_15230 [bacterium]|nr:hypothetical protein [bacterium]
MLAIHGGVDFDGMNFAQESRTYVTKPKSSCAVLDTGVYIAYAEGEK